MGNERKRRRENISRWERENEYGPLIFLFGACTALCVGECLKSFFLNDCKVTEGRSSLYANENWSDQRTSGCGWSAERETSTAVHFPTCFSSRNALAKLTLSGETRVVHDLSQSLARNEIFDLTLIVSSASSLARNLQAEEKSDRVS